MSDAEANHQTRTDTDSTAINDQVIVTNQMEEAMMEKEAEDDDQDRRG